MRSEPHGNVVYHGVELLILVLCLFLLTIPKSLLILKESLYTSVNCNDHYFLCNRIGPCMCLISSKWQKPSNEKADIGAGHSRESLIQYKTFQAGDLHQLYKT